MGLAQTQVKDKDMDRTVGGWGGVGGLGVGGLGVGWGEQVGLGLSLFLYTIPFA